MNKNFIVLLVLAIALPVPALAGTQINKHGNQLHSVEKLKIVSSTNSARKSKRQKCLDMMLPQDGVDCLKKLKAKKK